MPLDVLLAVMRGDLSITEAQYIADRDAAPYVHPKLAAVGVEHEHTGQIGAVLENPLTEEEWQEQFGHQPAAVQLPNRSARTAMKVWMRHSGGVGQRLPRTGGRDQT